MPILAKRTKFYTIQPHKTYHRDRFCSYLRYKVNSTTSFLAYEPDKVGQPIKWRDIAVPIELTSCPRCGR